MPMDRTKSAKRVPAKAAKREPARISARAPVKAAAPVKPVKLAAKLPQPKRRPARPEPRTLPPRPPGYKFPITEQAREAMLDRLEAAIIAGELTVNGQLYAELLAALFPEDCVTDYPLADKPTSTPPSSRERANVYVARARARRSLWHPGDAKAGGRLSMRPEKLVNSHRRAAKWEDEHAAMQRPDGWSGWEEAEDE